MSGRTSRPLAYAAAGAVATVILAGLAVLLATQGIETASKVAGIISMFVGIASLSVAISNALQARRAQRDKPGAGEASPALETSPENPSAPRVGSDIKIGKLNTRRAAIGDHNFIYFPGDDNGPKGPKGREDN